MVLLASSGFVSGTLEMEQDQLTEQALHANVVINALDAKGLYTTVIDASTRGEPAVAGLSGGRRRTGRWS